MFRHGFLTAALLLIVACSQAEDGRLGSSTGESSVSSSTGASGGTGGSGGVSSGTGDASVAPCDTNGVCGDYVNGCTGCAVSSTCSAAYDGCFGDESCLVFNKCLVSCKDDAACRNECTKVNPIGAERYGALVTCIVCQVCPNSCLEFADFCL